MLLLEALSHWSWFTYDILAKSSALVSSPSIIIIPLGT